ncbi:MAG: DUF3575 domain-containing protein [Flavisolibacter sp.]|nr:DUF3575 domain-containing protein [Flavisolibacter sp.]
MQPKHAISLALLCFSLTQLKAQTGPGSVESKNKQEQVNLVKLNLTALALKNYSFQYERTLNRKVSVALGVRTMPSTTLPFKNAIVKQVGDDDADTKNTIENFKLSNFSLTPEVRIYLSKKGYGRGFYLAPFYRYASFKTSTLNFDYEGAGTSGTISLSGKLTANTGGLMLGAQWPLSKRLSLDWWILGPHYGSGTGEFTGKTSHTMTAEEQNDLRNQLNDLDIPLTDKTVTVNANGATLKLDGPWGGIRSGILLGFKF